MNFHISYYFTHIKHFAVLRYNIALRKKYVYAGYESTNLGQTKQSFISNVAVAATVTVTVIVLLFYCWWRWCFLLSLFCIHCLSQYKNTVRDTTCQTLPAYMFHLTHHQLTFSHFIASSPNFSPACNGRMSNRAQQKAYKCFT